MAITWEDLRNRIEITEANRKDLSEMLERVFDKVADYLQNSEVCMETYSKEEMFGQDSRYSTLHKFKSQGKLSCDEAYCLLKEIKERLQYAIEFLNCKIDESISGKKCGPYIWLEDILEERDWILFDD